MSITEMLLSPNGRIRRRDFWLYSVGQGIVIWSMLKILIMLLWHGNRMQSSLQWFANTLTPLGLLELTLLLVGQWISFCLLAKRWHDRNRPAYFAVIWILITIVIVLLRSNMLLNLSASNVFIFNSVSLGLAPFVIWFFVECGCLAGTIGPNKYGPSPKGIIDKADVF